MNERLEQIAHMDIAGDEKIRNILENDETKKVKLTRHEWCIAYGTVEGLLAFIKFANAIGDDDDLDFMNDIFEKAAATLKDKLSDKGVDVDAEFAFSDKKVKVPLTVAEFMLLMTAVQMTIIGIQEASEDVTQNIMLLSSLTHILDKLGEKVMPGNSVPLSALLGVVTGQIEFETDEEDDEEYEEIDEEIENA